MDKFERLNWETNNYRNNTNIDPLRNSSNETRTSSTYFNYLNNQTFKTNNGQYSMYYF